MKSHTLTNIIIDLAKPKSAATGPGCENFDLSFVTLR